MAFLPDCNSRYRSAEYWDERYRTEESFDWFGDFSKFQHLLVQHVGKDARILMLGCGNSSLSWDMYQTGYCSITNVDYSRVCVEAMAQRHAHTPGLSWVCMDARRLAFPGATFQAVVEKGVLDAMLVGEKDPWNISNGSREVMHQVLSEISRVLEPGGRFVSVTFALPHFRKSLYARAEYGWSIKHYHYGDSFHYFLYVLTKGEELNPEDAALERRMLTEAPPTVVMSQDKESESFLNSISL
ncbi:EEF1A lysine methyltransferase 4 [Electrophorus electricus]|uniref:EEF1A lysine methyltransferase 4 n=1 Tax=Electrophorus electricus TaxID=8005 RepID=A0AAY5E8U6_ELEEL|nr:EEF1A lysine methyltransferase 4 [Electrophorus electricus]